jgi:hypothetical protein
VKLNNETITVLNYQAEASKLTSDELGDVITTGITTKPDFPEEEFYKLSAIILKLRTT